MPSNTERQRRFMGAELRRKRQGKRTKTGMSETQLGHFAAKVESHAFIKKAKKKRSVSR